MSKATGPSFSGHPDDAAIHRAVRTGVVPFQQHLDECEPCRELYEFLKICYRAERVGLAQPSTKSLSRYMALPFLLGNWKPRTKAVLGTIVHDSWKDLPATAVRDAPMGMERRLRFSSGRVVLEMVANRDPEGWHFVARVCRGKSPSQEFVLKIGRVRLQPGLHGCFHWASRKPPRKLQLLSPSLQFDLVVGTW